MQHIIEINSLKKTYNGKVAINVQNIHIKKGEIYGFLGPNGAGKSTMMKILLSLVKPDDSHVTIFGQQLGTQTDYLNKIGSLIEEPSYYPNLTGYENLQLMQKILGFPAINIERTLKRVGLFEAKDKLLKQYSLGMKQRLGLALALVKDPEVLILDEPTNGLDPSGVHEIRELIKQLSKEHNVTILLSSHILSEIEQTADRVGIINHGELIYENAIETIDKKQWVTIKGEFLAREVLEDAVRQFSEDISIRSFRNDEVTLSKMSKEIAGKLLKHLISEGLFIYEFKYESENLEAIFLRLTKGEAINEQVIS